MLVKVNISYIFSRLGKVKKVKESLKEMDK
jgi:hypothetical protein